MISVAIKASGNPNYPYSIVRRLHFGTAPGGGSEGVGYAELVEMHMELLEDAKVNAEYLVGWLRRQGSETPEYTLEDGLE